MPDESVHCCVTSPPYWGLRDYGTAKWEGGSGGCDHVDPKAAGDRARNRKGLAHNPTEQDGANRSLLVQNGIDKAFQYGGICGKCGARRVDKQLGLERVHDCLGWATGRPCGECYVCHLVAVFREVRRVLRDDGVLFLNLGDSYTSGGRDSHGTRVGYKQQSNRGTMEATGHRLPLPVGLKPKDLCGIPWRVALALQADGWWLRSDVIWHKPNPMPESVTDRPTRSHEYVFILTKSSRYYWDAEAVKENNTPGTVKRLASGPVQSMGGCAYNKGAGRGDSGGPYVETNGRNLRSVWTITTKPCKEAHFATFPPDLPERCIRAATSEKGVCPKCGKQWERVTEHHSPKFEKHCPKKRALIDAGLVGKNGGGHEPGWRKQEEAHTVTTGWRPGCECGLEPISATVLDPLAGIFTTGVVALRLGRSAIGCELNGEYCRIARGRIKAVEKVKSSKVEKRESVG